MVVIVVIITIIVKNETRKLERKPGQFHNPQVGGIPTCVLFYTLVDLVKHDYSVTSF